MGLATAQEFARRGAVTVLTDINEKGLTAALETVKQIDERAKKLNRLCRADFDESAGRRRLCYGQRMGRL